MRRRRHSGGGGSGGDGNDDNARLQIGPHGGVRRRFPRGNLGARGHYIVRIMCHVSDKLGLNTLVRDTRDPGALTGVLE